MSRSLKTYNGLIQKYHQETADKVQCFRFILQINDGHIHHRIRQQIVVPAVVSLGKSIFDHNLSNRIVNDTRVPIMTLDRIKVPHIIPVLQIGVCRSIRSHSFMESCHRQYHRTAPSFCFDSTLQYPYPTCTRVNLNINLLCHRT